MKNDDLPLLVQADGMAKMPPDTVVLTWNFLVQRRSGAEVKMELDLQAQSLLKRMAPLGLGVEDLQTEDETLGNWSEYRDNRYVNLGFEGRRTWILRMPLSNGLLPDLLDALVGSEIPCKVNHELSDPNLLEDESLRMAVIKAKRQANLMAAAAGICLGRLISLTRGELRIRQSWLTSELVCSESMAMPGGKEIEGVETVTMSWQIG